MAEGGKNIPDRVWATTDWYSLRPGACVRVLSGQWLGRWWWTIAVPLAAFLILGMWDLRFLIIAFLLLLVVVPAVMAFVYFTYALRPLTASSIFPHRVLFSQDRLTVEYRPMQVNRKQKKKQRVKNDESDESDLSDQSDETETIAAPVSVTLPYKDIVRAESTGAGLLLQLASDRKDLLYIPSDAFESPRHASEATTAIKAQSSWR